MAIDRTVNRRKLIKSGRSPSNGTFNERQDLCSEGVHRMPRFFFNYVRGGLIAKDDDGIDLPGLEEAKAIAMVSARELLVDNIKAGSEPIEALTITDARGQELHTIHAKDALPEKLKAAPEAHI
jgi:hypothetical protein